MKKLLSLLAIALLMPISVYAFNGATLYKGTVRVAVKTIKQANNLFASGYKLEQKAGAMLGYAPTTGYSERLTQSITDSATTIYVSSVKDRDGSALPLSSTNKGYFTVESGTSREEAIVCTGVSTSSVTLTGCTRGLLATGDSEAGGGLKYSHNAGSRIIMTNIAQFYGNYVDISTNQTITGMKSVSTPTSANHIANKSYVDDVAIAGAPNASISVKGISKLSSSPASSTNPIALNSEEVATTTSANKVVRANSSGYLDSSWLGSTQSYSLGSTTTVTGTLNVSATTTFTGLTKVATSTPTVAGQVVGLDSNAKLPAVDGSQLTMMATAGVVTDLATTTAGNNDVSVTLNFQPSIIKLYYFIQGHSPSTGYANYQAQKGVAIYNGNTLAGVYLDMSTNNLQYALTGDDGYYSISGSNPTFISNIPNSTTNPSVGAYSSAEGCRVELSIPTISSTGFTIRRQTSFVTSCSYTMRAKIMYEAYR